MNRKHSLVNIKVLFETIKSHQRGLLDYCFLEFLKTCFQLGCDPFSASQVVEDQAWSKKKNQDNFILKNYIQSKRKLRDT